LSHTGSRMIVAGDFNCRIDIPDKCDRGALLREGLEAVGLDLASESWKSTYIDFNNGNPRCSTIDLLFTNIHHRLLKSHLAVERDAAFPKKHLQVHSKWHLSSGNCGMKSLVKKRQVCTS